MMDLRSRRLGCPATGLLVTGLVLLVLVTGCTGGSQARPRPSAQPPTTASSDPQAEQKLAALAAYWGMWNAFAEAGETADYKSRDVLKYTVGKARARLVSVLLEYHENGVVTKGRPVLHPKVTSVQPAGAPRTVEVLDCGDSTNWTKHHRSSGKLIKEPSGQREITATVVLKDGAWKVSVFDVGDLGSC